MKKFNSFNELQELMYSGQLEEKQFPVESFVDYEVLSPAQYKMYKHVMVGIEMYTPQELYAMNSSKKSKIFKRHKQTQMALNIWKQELTNAWTNKLFASWFPNSPLAIDIVSDNSTSKNFINTLAFRDLGISKKDIINKLITENILPKNFAVI